MSSERSLVRTFSSEIEAHGACAHLEAAGIAAWLLKDDAGGAYPQLTAARGVRLLVGVGDVDKAKKVMAHLDTLAASTSPVHPDEVEQGARLGGDEVSPRARMGFGVFAGLCVGGVLGALGVLAVVKPPTAGGAGTRAKLRTDSNGDGQIDRVFYLEGDSFSREEVDRNHDGRVDLWRTFAPLATSVGAEPGSDKRLHGGSRRNG